MPLVAARLDRIAASPNPAIGRVAGNDRTLREARLHTRRFCAAQH